MRLSLASLTNVSSRSLDSFSLGEKVRMSANRARVGGEIPKSSVALYRRGWMGRDWRAPGRQFPWVCSRVRRVFKY
jgi:hypothetical protein